MWLVSVTYSYWSVAVQHAPQSIELSDDLKKRIVAAHQDVLGYKKIANTLKLSCSKVG